MCKILKICPPVALAVALSLQAQQPVTLGKGSYAAYPPAYKAKTDQHDGFNATKMMTRKIYADETDKSGNPRPIPTNDWWTDVIVSQFSGAMWSYPSMLKTSSEGVTVAFPTHWNENGTEVKSDTRLIVGAVGFTAREARATDWHDWDVEVCLPATNGNGAINATLVHGSPFSWFEFDGVTGAVSFPSTPEITDDRDGAIMIKIDNDLYGLYFDRNASPRMTEGTLRLDGSPWLAVAPLPSEELFDTFAPYASSVIRSTTLVWGYDEKSSTLQTIWRVNAENLADPGGAAPVLQGFLPHAYKHYTSSNIEYTTATYLTPRGTMKIAASKSGRFEYAYHFPGMLPYYAAPAEGDDPDNGYSTGTMRSLIEAYATKGSFGDDTYWGGKGLTQMALNMTFAQQTGNTGLYETSKSKLRDALTDWLTYTTGESTKFFAYYPRWGGMLGFDVSYDSDAFNDHHFHYGYFIYAAALLCLEDESFRRDYGDLLRMIVKDYANYDRSDSRFPFLRTLDPWAGHSYAGGLGDHGNDNGNGQESSSEAMQGWGGVYLMGVALGDKLMRDAGIFGWLTESRATAEYWFDRDHIHHGRQHNYDYTLYTSPYNTNLTSKGIGWWTWFSGDPLWMHSIQWMPVSPCLNYMSEDLDFVKWDYETMRNATAYKWFEKTGSDDALANQSVGNVVLCYMERYDPKGAAAIFDRALKDNYGIARNIDTGHISYYVIHSHLTYGDIDFGVSADCPTANAYRRADGTMTYIVYNPDMSERTVKFYRNGAIERTVKAPARMMTAFSDESRPASVEITVDKGLTIPPGSTATATGKLLDQYGASTDGQKIEWSIDAPAEIDGNGMITIPASARRGSSLEITAKSGPVVSSATITVNDPPHSVSSCIKGVPEFIETGDRFNPVFESTDQYGNVTVPDAEWTISDGSGNSTVTDITESRSVSFDHSGIYTLTATHDGATASAKVVAVPPLPNVAPSGIASASSEENVGTKAGGAIDGDRSTRWGSEHSDNQWFMVDTRKNHRISAVVIDWEAAYAADYDILTAPDGADTDNPDAWTTVVSQRGLSGPGIVRHPLSVTARYVKIKCLRRGSAYGYSIIEISICGVDDTLGPDAVAGLELTAPTMITEGKTADVSASTFTFGGVMSPVGSPQWSSTPEGIFDGNKFTPTTYGNHTLTARYGDLTASRNVLVEESVKLKSLSAYPSKLSLLTGDEGHISIEGYNQFGGMYDIGPEDIEITVTGSDGKPVGHDVASFTPSTGQFRAIVRGDYTVDFGGLTTAEVKVRDIAEANLAAGKSVRASSSTDTGAAVNLTDLDMDTRWESAHSDNEWVAIDLGGAYIIDRVVLHWEGAYASSYRIDTSLDGENWFSAYETTSGSGGKESLTLNDIPASHIRLYCLRRATIWGNSLYEIEVYGKDRYIAPGNASSPKIDDVTYTTGNGSIDGKVNVSHPDGLAVFTSVTLTGDDGNVAARHNETGSPVKFSFSNLPAGSYILEVTATGPDGKKATHSSDVDIDFTIRGVNLALKKNAGATSTENDALGASYAVDGDLSTRWGSLFNDDESIWVDLGKLYMVDNIKVMWNQPAFATHYSVALSTDGNDYSTVGTRADWNGADDSFAIVPKAARYVKLTGHKRATGYGTSVNELEVYGDDYNDTSLCTISLDDDINLWSPVEVFTMTGCPIGRAVSLQAIAYRLQPGIYLVTNGRQCRKFAIK